MPPLPKSLFKHRKSYYLRARIGGRLVRRSLGADHSEAIRRYRIIKSHPGGVRAYLGEQIVEPVIGSTVADLGVKWLTDYISTRRNPKGRELAATRFNRYILPTMGHLDVQWVEPRHFRELRLMLEKQGLSAQTVAHILSDARCFFKWLADEMMLLPRSPFPARLMPRIQEQAPRRHTPEEIAQVLVSVPPIHAFMIRLALSTGLRWSEIQRLQWRHLTWEPLPHLVIERTKSGRVRRVPLSADIAECLRARQGKGTAPICPYRNPQSTSFNRSVRKLSGVHDFSFHRLRHTFAAQWLEAGGSIEGLRLILGHSTVRLTESYGKVSDIAVLKEAQNISQSISHVAAPVLRVIGTEPEGKAG